MKKERKRRRCSQAPLRFNPCSNGMKKEPAFFFGGAYMMGGNPCSNGMKKEL